MIWFVSGLISGFMICASFPQIKWLLLPPVRLQLSFYFVFFILHNIFIRALIFYFKPLFPVKEFWTWRFFNVTLTKVVYSRQSARWVLNPWYSLNLHCGHFSYQIFSVLLSLLWNIISIIYFWTRPCFPASNHLGFLVTFHEQNSGTPFISEPC